MSVIEHPIFNSDLQEVRHELQNSSHDLDRGMDQIMERIEGARIVLMGEASHGTHEYYIWRAMLTKRLIQEKRFNIIGVEGDWPDGYRINRYIKSFEKSGNSAPDVLQKHNRWPTWMWSNWEVAALMEWLRFHNTFHDENGKVGFYGLDVYSLWESLQAIMDYLEKHDYDAFKTAEEALHCFEPYGSEGAAYGAASRYLPKSCEEEVLALLKKIRERKATYNTDPEAPFFAEQNARAVVNAERYYRAMMDPGPGSWNIRDHHMVDTLGQLMDFYGEDSKAIVWEHNTHIGDARATDMNRNGLVNVGQLVRERWGMEDTVAIGFGSNSGSVMAGTSWGAPAQKMTLPPARENSWEAMLHEAMGEDCVIISNEMDGLSPLHASLPHRAIGVVYDPDQDHRKNYVQSIIPQRYDAFVYLDRTKALHPITTDADMSRMPATYPWQI